jgi:D-alanine-D-alanine ligase
LSQKSGKKIRVALISGGRSGEHEISLRSAASVRQALDCNRYELVEFFIDKNGRWSPQALKPEPDCNPGIDIVFPMLHGTFGEDGTVQGLLELAELPFVGAGVLASALSMDKVMTKRVCREAGLPVVDFIVAKRGCDVDSLDLPFDYPLFVKPANLGSSVGISKVKSRASLRQAFEAAASFDSKIIIERGITGREFECAVIDGEPVTASIPCEILPSQEFYTYEDKYLLDTARIELPARLTPEETAEVQRLAVATFEAVCCEGLARVDFLMEASTGQFFVNEINTLPGFTSISMFPKMWEFSGLPYSQLLDRLINLALERAEERRGTRYAR